jgi:hypothetical protein
MAGHDHNNDFYGNYYGIDLHYGRKTGYGSYGPPDGVLKGATVYNFKYDISSDTLTYERWTRQEDGSIDMAVT